MTYYEDDEEEEFKIEEPNDSDFADEHGESATYIDSNQKAPTLRNNIKFFIQGVRSRIKYATPSFTMKVARILFIDHSWTIWS